MESMGNSIYFQEGIRRILLLWEWCLEAQRASPGMSWAGFYHSSFQIPGTMPILVSVGLSGAEQHHPWWAHSQLTTSQALGDSHGINELKEPVCTLHAAGGFPGNLNFPGLQGKPELLHFLITSVHPVPLALTGTLQTQSAQKPFLCTVIILV